MLASGVSNRLPHASSSGQKRVIEETNPTPTKESPLLRQKNQLTERQVQQVPMESEQTNWSTDSPELMRTDSQDSLNRAGAERVPTFEETMRTWRGMARALRQPQWHQQHCPNEWRSQRNHGGLPNCSTTSAITWRRREVTTKNSALRASSHQRCVLVCWRSAGVVTSNLYQFEIVVKTALLINFEPARWIVWL